MLNSLTQDITARLQTVLPAAALKDPEPRYLEDPRGRFAGKAGVVVAPSTTEEVAAVVREANAARVPIVPFGGGTGLVGGQVLAEGPMPILLSLERLNRIREVNTDDAVLVAEAGVILATVQDAARERGFLFPLSIASEGSARIGGNLSTNAGGLNVLRYGNCRDLCLGIEAVLPDGNILHGLKRLRKDNTGYDLRHLLIGAEGTLGVITAAALRLFPVPTSQATGYLAVPDPASALALLSMARARLGEAISAFELIAAQALRFLDETGVSYRDPLPERPDWAVLIDVGLSGQGGAGDAAAALEALFEEASAAGLVTDGILASSEAQRADLWHLREVLPEGNKRVGAVASHDVSLPLSRVAEFLDRGRQVIASVADVRINCYGHLGDGNLHYNVFPQPGRKAADYGNVRDALIRAVHDLVADCNGSISAEHGIGRMKVDDLERYGDPAKLAAMRAIKSALDPNGIMNPGAVLKS
ncbi:MAG: FAD-binding oxidoreductase [Pseudomonadota bacterium]